MRNFFSFLLIFSLAGLWASYDYFSPVIREKTINSEITDFPYFIGEDFIIANSDTVYAGKIVLERNIDYIIDYNNKSLNLYDPDKYASLRIIYKIYPENLLSEFSFYDPKEYVPGKKYKKKTIINKFSDNSTNLNISGSKTISFEIGRGEQLNIDQSLFLRVDGEISEGVFAEAQLSDDQTPITPEGDSRELSSLDQIYIKIYGKKSELALGDLDFKIEESRFLNYNPKFEGIRFSVRNKGRYRGAVGVTKSKPAHIEFNGTESKQGPYFINFNGSDQFITVVSGSESIYLNGELLQRGEDYTIDYDEGTVNFKQTHFISETSFIVADYQYSSEEYQRNLYMADTETRFTDQISFKNKFIYQKDAKNNPLSYSLAEEDKIILSEAGDSEAFAEAIQQVEDGEGEYAQIIEGENIYYEYVGLDSSGNYNVNFLFVGEGKGDYVQISSSRWEYVGKNLGDWLPMKKIPKAESKMNYNASLKYENDYFVIYSEALISEYDKNLNSNLDDDDNLGGAVHEEIKIKPDYDLLNPEAVYYYRYIFKNTSFFSDPEDPQFIYTNNGTTLKDSLDTQEHGVKISFDIYGGYKPEFSYFNRKIKSWSIYDRFQYRHYSEQYKIFPNMKHNLIFTEEEMENNALKTRSQHWHDFLFFYEIADFKPGININYRNLEEKFDSAKIGRSTLNSEYFIKYDKNKSLFSEVSFKEENLYGNSNLSDKEKFIQTYAAENLLGKNGHLVGLRFYHRRSRDYENHNTSKSEMAEITSLNRFLNDGLNLNTEYSLINEEFYPKVSELIYVGEGEGIYDSTGTAVENGDFDKVFTLAGTPELSVKVDFELNANIFFKRFVKKNYVPIIRDLQWESAVRLSQQSTSPERFKLYIFHPDYFMKDSLAVYSFYNFENTLWWSFSENKYILKSYLSTSKSQDRRYYENDINKSIEYGIMLRLNKLKRHRLEFAFDGSIESDGYYESEIQNGKYSAELRTMINRMLTFTTEIFYGRETGDKRNKNFDYEINYYGINENITYYIGRKYRFSTELRIKKNDRSGSDFLTGLKEKRNGMSKRWKLNLNYKVNSFTNADLQYTGEKYPGSTTENTLYFKVTASF
ncbi:MAG: hypothetical protein CSB55_01745 [Candidatus Cloacimonadota bacterium]|nr:MAG: hypothetical protein CSB55_01745 [Candidatus Cloacimonadota bacterium]